MNKRKEKGIFRRKRLKKAEKGIYGILPERPGSTDYISNIFTITDHIPDSFFKIHPI